MLLSTCLPCVAFLNAGKQESWRLSDAARCALKIATRLFGLRFWFRKVAWLGPTRSISWSPVVLRPQWPGSNGHWGTWWLLSSWSHPCSVPWCAYANFLANSKVASVFIPGIRPALVGLHGGWRGEEVKVNSLPKTFAYDLPHTNYAWQWPRYTTTP